MYPHRHQDFKNIPTHFFDHTQKIVKFDNYEHVFWLELLITPNFWNVTKAVFVMKT